MKSRFVFKIVSILAVLSLVFSLAIFSRAATAMDSGPVKADRVTSPAVAMPTLEEIDAYPGRANGTFDVMLEMFDAPTAVVYMEKIDARMSETAAAASARMRFAQISAAQETLVQALDALKADAQVLFTAQTAYNGVAVTIPSSKLDLLKTLPGVKAVHLIIPKTIDNSATVPFINAPYAWSFGTTYLGDGVTVGVIDTGIDYLHTDLGGPGTGYGSNDTTVVGDAPNFPGVKVVGGFDFAGDAYSAGGSAPAPDFDPMDCNGHGSHVSGTIAGFGVNADGSTYTGPWGSGSDFDAMRIGPGVAPKAQLYGLRVFGCSGSTSLTTAAIDWAVDPNNDGDPSDHLDVINMSLGSSFGSAYDDSAVASDNAVKAGVIVVASAGNSYDTHYNVGSPSVAVGALSVAAIVDPVDIMDGFEVVNDPGPNTVYGSSNSINFNWANKPSTTGDLVYPDINRGGCIATGAVGGWTAAQYTGKILLLDWTYTFAPSNTSECGSSTRVTNAYNAGAAGVLFANTKPYLDIAIGGAASIPATITTLATGDILKTALGSGTVSVVLTNAHNGTVRNEDPTIADTMSAFSSRGPSRINNLLKPDIAAPGQTIFSIDSGSGNLGTSLNGTSMAAPHMAGVMALLKQLHPTWTVEELKALAMNTATHNITTGAEVYPGSRMGAGRVDVQNAVLNNVIAYNAMDANAVSVSFGDVQVPVSTTVTLSKNFVVVNKNGSLNDPITFDVAFQSYSSLPSDGVTFSVVDADDAPVTSLTLDPGEEVMLTVKMTAEGSLMKHYLDKSMYDRQGTTLSGANAVQFRFWMSQYGGNVILSPAGGMTAPVNGLTETVRLPVFAVARPVSTMSADAMLSMPGTTGTVELNLNGGGLSTGGASPAYPTDLVSLVSAFELKAVSPEIEDLDPVFASGDIEYVGLMSTRPYAGSWSASYFYFAISTYGNWSTPSAYDTEFDIYIDTNKDGNADVIAYNFRFNADGSGNPTDVFTAYYYIPTAGTLTSAGIRLNGIAPNYFDTNLYNTNVMVIPVPVVAFAYANCGGVSCLPTDGDPTFDFWISSYTREAPGEVDMVGPIRYDAMNLAVDTLDGYAGIPMYNDLPGTFIPVKYNKANATDGFLGLLLLHHHNGDGDRAQVVELLTNHVYIPNLFSDFAPAP